MKLKVFLSQMSKALGEEKFLASIKELLELIDFEWQSQKAHTRMLCMRGLLMLLHLESLQDNLWQGVSTEILGKLNKIFAESTASDDVWKFSD
jgi:hypothetical protein